jgi:hypothetical protein
MGLAYTKWVLHILKADGNGDGGCLPAADDDGESEWQASNLYEVYV